MPRIEDLVMDILGTYSTLATTMSAIEDLIRCLTRAYDESKACIQNPGHCIRVTLEDIEPCYLRSLGNMQAVLGPRFYQQMWFTAWAFGGKGGTERRYDQIRIEISSHIVNATIVIDFMISAARIALGSGTQYDKEIVEMLFDRVNEILKSMRTPISRPDSVFLRRPYTALLHYAALELHRALDVVRVEADRLKVEAYRLAK